MAPLRFGRSASVMTLAGSTLAVKLIRAVPEKRVAVVEVVTTGAPLGVMAANTLQSVVLAELAPRVAVTGRRPTVLST